MAESGQGVHDWQGERLQLGPPAENLDARTEFMQGHPRNWMRIAKEAVRSHQRYRDLRADARMREEGFWKERRGWGLPVPEEARHGEET